MMKVPAIELSSRNMIAGNEKKYSIVVDDGVVKQWVGIGWLELRLATPVDRKDYPVVDRK